MSNLLNGLNNELETIRDNKAIEFNNQNNDSFVDQFMTDLKNNPHYFEDNLD